MSDRDDRIESLLRMGPPEEDRYLPPPIAELPTRPVTRLAHDGRAGAPRGRAPIFAWVSLAAAAAVISVIGASLFLAFAGRPPNGGPLFTALPSAPTIASTPTAPAATAAPSATAQPQATTQPQTSAQPKATDAALRPFPSVAPDATTTTGTLQPGEVAVIADDHGPLLMVRVRSVQQVASVPGRTPASDGNVFLDVTVDVDVLRDVSQVLFGWKAFGAQEVSTPTWPANQIDMRNLAPGLRSGHVGFEVPPAGQVLWRALNTTPSESPQFELRAEAASASPTLEASAAPGDWVGLDWSAPATLPGPVGGSAMAGDIVAWNGGYVIAGGVQGSDGSSRAAAWFSSDGTTWSQTFTDDPGRGHSYIQFVRAVGGVVVGVGTSGVDHCSESGAGQTCDPLPVAIWTSADGRTWARQATPAIPAGVEIGDIASGPAGGMLIGDTGWNHA